jgi:hypothetical protein
MGKLTDMIGERRRRQENPDRIVAIFRIFIDPITRKESTATPRTASVVGGPRLWQQHDESDDAFESRVMGIAHQLRDQKGQVV